ncbi:MAG TPA: hypothetical protein PK843_03105 [bacterium]|nr:hypothetical protein [bacterium]HPN33472.1 hypothetical protein [bacterium]
MRESTLWFWHLLAGAVILILLALHMTIMHLDDLMGLLGLSHGDPIDQKIVFARSQQVFFMITYILLLGAALYHGLYGLRTILFELTLSRTLERTVNIILTVSGLALFVYGAYAAAVIYLMKEVQP